MITAKEYLKDKTIVVTVNGVNCKMDHSTDLENLLESYHKIKAENLPISDVSERKWSVDEIIERLDLFKNIKAASAWFNTYGR